LPRLSRNGPADPGSGRVVGAIWAALFRDGAPAEVLASAVAKPHRDCAAQPAAVPLRAAEAAQAGTAEPVAIQRGAGTAAELAVVSAEPVAGTAVALVVVSVEPEAGTAADPVAVLATVAAGTTGSLSAATGAARVY
jgi:hypothetical protein